MERWTNTLNLSQPTCPILSLSHAKPTPGPHYTYLCGWLTITALTATTAVWGFESPILLLLHSLGLLGQIREILIGHVVACDHQSEYLWSILEEIGKEGEEERGFQIPELLHWLERQWQLITHSRKVHQRPGLERTLGICSHLIFLWKRELAL